MSGTGVEVEDYEEVIGDLYYDASVEAGPNADSFKEPTLNQNINSLTPQNRLILRSSNLSLAGDLQESIAKVVIIVAVIPVTLSPILNRRVLQASELIQYCWTMTTSQLM